VNKEEEYPWLNNWEFQKKYRVSQEAFEFILRLIKDHPIFKPLSGKSTRKQAPVEHQLMVFLKYIGTEGTGANNPGQRSTFGIGEGTAELYCNCIVEALCSFRDEYIRWPDEEEREVIAKRMLCGYGWPHVVAIADGTLFPLASEPQTEDAPDYSGCKYQYSLSVMILCDDTRKIWYYLGGWPGSAHDNQIFWHTKIAKNAKRYFSPHQYLIGDSAFEKIGLLYRLLRNQQEWKFYSNISCLMITWQSSELSLSTQLEY